MEEKVKLLVIDDFSSAVESGKYDEVVDFLEKGADPNLLAANGYRPLHKAITKGHIKIVNLLLKYSADVNLVIQIKFNGSVYPLHLAAIYGRLEILKLLLKSGADINSKGDNDFSALHWAIQEDQTHVVRYFLENNLLDVEDPGSRTLHTPLQWAAFNGRPKILELLLNHGANINRVNMLNNSALHCACAGNFKDHEDAVKLLIRRGAKLDEKTYHGETALHMCVTRGYLNLVKLLVEGGATAHLDASVTGNNPVLLAVQHSQIKVLKYFIDVGISVNFQTSDGYSLLHCAARFNEHKIVKFLIKKGADVGGVIYSRGSTPLHIASSFIFTRVIEILIANGADLTVKDKKYRTPLEVITQYLSSDLTGNSRAYFIKCVKVLVKYMLLLYANIQVSMPSDYPVWANMDDFKRYCIQEIEQMKTVFIDNTTVSLYMFLRDILNEKKLSTYLCNDHLQQEVKHIRKYIKNFKIYSDISTLVTEQIKKGMLRKSLLEEAGIAIEYIAPQLIVECKTNIFKYLNNMDLSNLIQSLKM